MLIGGTEGRCRGMDVALIRDAVGEHVEDRVLHVILRSSMALRLGAAETCSYDLSEGPPSATTTSGSETPRSCSSVRSFLFSSRTFLAAVWISEEASMPACSTLRILASSSWRYSLRRARERPKDTYLLAKCPFQVGWGSRVDSTLTVSTEMTRVLYNLVRRVDNKGIMVDVLWLSLIRARFCAFCYTTLARSYQGTRGSTYRYPDVTHGDVYCENDKAMGVW